MTELEKAIDIIATSILIAADLPDWENYDGIGEYDWEAVQEALVKKQREMKENISHGAIRAAYRFLENRANAEGGKDMYTE